MSEVMTIAHLGLKVKVTGQGQRSTRLVCPPSSIENSFTVTLLKSDGRILTIAYIRSVLRHCWWNDRKWRKNVRQ